MPRKPTPDPEKYCERCGKRLARKRYGKTLEDMGRFLARKYCSLRCANSRGIHTMNSTSQHEISQRFRKKRCERCGAKPKRSKLLHVHHKNGNWRDHRPENLETLCIGCHLGRGHCKTPPKKCKHCQAKARKHGMCQKHFQRWKKYGDPFLTKRRKKGTPSSYEIVREP